MSGYTLTWQPDAVDDLIGLAMSLRAGDIKAIQDNAPLLLDDPRPVNARRQAGYQDRWILPVGAIEIAYEIIADSVISILGVRRSQ